MERESSSLVTLDRSCSATDSRVPYGMTKERDKLREKGGGGGGKRSSGYIVQLQ